MLVIVRSCHDVYAGHVTLVDVSVVSSVGVAVVEVVDVIGVLDRDVAAVGAVRVAWSSWTVQVVPSRSAGRELRPQHRYIAISTYVALSGEVGTPEVVRSVFGIDSRVIDDPVTGTPLVVPVGRSRIAAVR